MKQGLTPQGEALNIMCGGPPTCRGAKILCEERSGAPAVLPVLLHCSDSLQKLSVVPHGLCSSLRKSVEDMEGNHDSRKMVEEPQSVLARTEWRYLDGSLQQRKTVLCGIQCL